MKSALLVWCVAGLVLAFLVAWLGRFAVTSTTAGESAVLYVVQLDRWTGRVDVAVKFGQQDWVRQTNIFIAPIAPGWNR